MKVAFNKIFKVRHNELQIKDDIMVGGIIIKKNYLIQDGISFSGIDFTQFIGRDLEIDNQNGIIIIKGIY